MNTIRKANSSTLRIQTVILSTAADFIKDFRKKFLTKCYN